MEKTFEELIDEKFGYDVTKSGKYLLTRIEIVTIMQQVREATKAEILTLCDENFFSKEPKGKLMENIENLPTDRIKLTENK